MMLIGISTQKYHRIFTFSSIGYYKSQTTCIKFFHAGGISDEKFKMAQRYTGKRGHIRVVHCVFNILAVIQAVSLCYWIVPEWHNPGFMHCARRAGRERVRLRTASINWSAQNVNDILRKLDFCRLDLWRSSGYRIGEE